MGFEPISSQLPRRRPSPSISKASPLPGIAHPSEQKIPQLQSSRPSAKPTLPSFKQRLESHHPSSAQSNGPPSIPLPVLPPLTSISGALLSTFSNDFVSFDSNATTTSSKSLPKLNNILSRASSISLTKVISPQKPTTTLEIQPNSLHSPRAKNSTFSTYSPAVNSNHKPQPAPSAPENSSSTAIQAKPIKTKQSSDLTRQKQPDHAPLNPTEPSDPSEHAIEALASPKLEASWKNALTGHTLSFLTDTGPSSLSHSDSHHAFNRQSTVSTWTLASNRSSSIEDLSSNLASIQLPSRPIDQEHQQHPAEGSTSPVLISDFPLPPSRDSFQKLDPTSPLFSSLDIALLSPTIMQSSSLPPQIPLPPIPSSSLDEGPDDVSSMTAFVNNTILLYQEETPKLPSTLLPPHHRFSRLLESFQSSSVPEAPDHSVDLLDLYMDRTASSHSIPSPTRADLKHPESLKKPNSMHEPATKHAITRSNSCDSTSCDMRRAEEMDDMVNDPQLEIYSHELSAIDSDGEETSSEIDLNEPLEAMAVRLGYQFESDLASDSDGESDVGRSREIDEDTDLLQNFPYHYSPLLSRQTQRSQSSLRSNVPLPIKRFKRLVIAEASSSDEEQFDLTLDHRPDGHRGSNGQTDTPNQRKWYSRRGSNESMGTTVSFSTTPSSSQLSYQTNLSTPNSTQALKLEHSSLDTIGLGFEMEVLGARKISHIDPHLPGLPGSQQRREWLQRGLNRAELTFLPPSDLSPSRATSLNPHQEGLAELQPSLFHESEVQGGRIMSATQRNSGILPARNSGILTGRNSSILGEQHNRLDDEGVEMILQSPKRIRNSIARNSSNGLRLKPLMLVDRKSRGLSYPSSSTNFEGDDRRSSISSRVLSGHVFSPASDYSPTSPRHSHLTDLVNLVKPRPSLANISYRSSISSLIPRSPVLN